MRNAEFLQTRIEALMEIYAEIVGDKPVYAFVVLDTGEKKDNTLIGSNLSHEKLKEFMKEILGKISKFDQDVGVV